MENHIIKKILPEIFYTTINIKTGMEAEEGWYHYYSYCGEKAKIDACLNNSNPMGWLTLEKAQEGNSELCKKCENLID